MKKVLTTLLIVLTISSCQSKPNKVAEIKKEVVKTEIKAEDTIKPVGKFKDLVLVNRIQSLDSTNKIASDIYDPAILSPKSAIFSKDGTKFYINSLEGYTTVVFNSKTLKKIKEITHRFNEKNNNLFKNNENTIYDYKFKQERPEYNHFLGKPVESCLSHNGKYLWVTYYRRNWDENAEMPSAVAIIDTETDKIIRVMPSGPLPKMIACSADNKFVAVTHWGDNTVAIIDVSSNNVFDFKYVAHTDIDQRLVMNYNSNVHVNRDNDCGNCLRGTVFTPDNQYLLIAKMGGNGLAVVETKTFKYLGTITGMKTNLRHLLINNNEILLSSNKYGFVQKANLTEVLNQIKNLKNNQDTAEYTNWQTVDVGIGARTIDVTNDGKYIFACVNNKCKIAVINGKTMEMIKTVDVAKFPVGMAISLDGKQLIVTSQGKDAVYNSGNTVSVFQINYE
jgi:DNA-binding beta-propeller fold protein YncE